MIKSDEEIQLIYMEYSGQVVATDRKGNGVMHQVCGIEGTTVLIRVLFLVRDLD
jgi:hypothetical protein